MLEIVNVRPGGEAARLGLKPGDAVISVNGHQVDDVIDFRFFVAEEQISLVIRRAGSSVRIPAFKKDPDDNLGLEFAPLKITRCRNNCIFCFVDQMPPGCRDTLYVKDDDFRASFLYGNFITLGALSEQGWERIFRQRLSPLYISVHTTDPVLRSSILRNKKSPDIMGNLRRLATGGITMHTQIVACPGVNDGDHLIKTITDLSGLFPAVSSIAVVPVGITMFRKGLFPLKGFTRAEARAVIECVHSLSAQFKRKCGTRLVFASDEFYIKAAEPVPSPSFYEDFPQIENGVGMVADFLSGVSRTRTSTKIGPITATIVTGVSFNNILRGTLARFRGIPGVVLKQVAVQNRFFGPSVTVAGLLTGGDILRALKGKRIGDMVMIPSNALKEDEDIFLDNMSLEELGHRLKVKTVRVGSFRELKALLRGSGRSEA